MFGLFGGKLSESINDYKCERHKVTVQAQVKTKKKLNKKFEYSYQEYFEGAEDFEEGDKPIEEKDVTKIAKDKT